MKFEDIILRALAIKSRYTELEKQKYGKAWDGKDLAMGFVGDVGELAQLVAAKEGIRDIENTDEKLAHELADCLWSIIALADKYGVDLEKAFTTTMDELDKRLDRGEA